MESRSREPRDVAASPEDGDLLAQYLEIIWSNIRHNESARDRFFSLYLLIAGAFFVILEADDGSRGQRALTLQAAIFIALVGLLFLWAFTRYRAMIRRDVSIMRQLNSRILEGSAGLPQVHRIYERYYEDAARKRIFKLWATTNVLMCAVALVSSAIVAVAAHGAGWPRSQGLLLIVAVSLLGHYLYCLLIGRVAA